MKRLRAVNEAMKKAELWFGTGALILIFVLITVNIVMRYILNKAFSWAGEFNGFLYAWIAFIAAAYSMAEDGHVRIALFDNRFGMRVTQIVRIGTDLITIVAFVWLFFPTVNALAAMKLTAALRWPKGIVYSGLLVGYALYIVHSAIQIVRRVNYLKTGVDAFEVYPNLDGATVPQEGR